ncbi:diguanylate cyclase (GGDEF) domain-containing protein [Monaibacterium marinum]|uniref:Diguanylate cyclase (GGDEF) domain-containing protein n=1 Tax=Pontivivens marinum TaxID=1690039 RepID=A0A2C9CTI4_9RHOB|nr:EAL domain-containing protein [Monaibacterium marinum]SOH94548.1 diguanylate cyclase (GGDEF) domain-containing protein [Monaibacterium marinum]
MQVLERVEDPIALEILGEFIETMNSPVFIKTPQQMYLYANAAFQQLFPDVPIAGQSCDSLFCASDAQVFAEEDHHCLQSGRTIAQRSTPDGRLWLVEKAVITLPDGSRGIAGLVFDITSYRDQQQGAIRDLGLLKREAEQRALLLAEANEKIEYVSLHDAHTGLANRRYLERRLEEAAADGEHLAVLHIDLDRFKQINDTFGHFTGDYVLRHVAKTMVQESRLGDFVARVGGDEFAILCRYSGDASRVLALAERLVERLSQPIRCKGVECRTGASIGVALPEFGTVEPRQLLLNADVALYRAKTGGRGRVEIFSRSMDAEMKLENRLSEDMIRGLERSEFRPVYEVQVRADTFELCGVEALARWHHPEDGLLAPGRFAAVAERDDRMGAIDKMILQTACADMEQLREEGIEIPCLSVNVSAQRLAGSELIEELRELKITPGSLSFELVETVLFDETDATWQWQIDRIRDLGIGIEIDDFGTGYASIVSLLRLNPDRMKIDRQFTAALTGSDHSRRVIAAMIEIGRALNVDIVAEGVETLEQARILREMGCGVLQGWLFSKPMDIDALAAFARQSPQARLLDRAR